MNQYYKYLILIDGQEPQYGIATKEQLCKILCDYITDKESAADLYLSSDYCPLTLESFQRWLDIENQNQEHLMPDFDDTIQWEAIELP